PAPARRAAPRATRALRRARARMAALSVALARRALERGARAVAHRRGRDSRDRLSLGRLEDVDDALFRGVAVVLAELRREDLRQLAGLRQLLHDVGAAHELALHEERDRLVLDDILDAIRKLVHVVPLVLIRSSWMVPSRSGSASASFTSR